MWLSLTRHQLAVTITRRHRRRAPWPSFRQFASASSSAQASATMGLSMGITDAGTVTAATDTTIDAVTGLGTIIVGTDRSGGLWTADVVAGPLLAAEAERRRVGSAIIFFTAHVQSSPTGRRLQLEPRGGPR